MLIPLWILFGLSGLVLLGCLLLMARMRRYRQRIDVLEEQALMAQARVTPTQWHPDHRPENNEALEALQEKHKRLVAAYQTLHSRHTSLLDELRRRQQNALGAKDTDTKANGHPVLTTPSGIPSYGPTQPEDAPKS